MSIFQGERELLYVYITVEFISAMQTNFIFASFQLIFFIIDKLDFLFALHNHCKAT